MAGTGVVAPYRGPIDPHTGLPVDRIGDAKRAKAAAESEGRTKTENFNAQQAALAAQRAGLNANTSYRDAYTGTSYDYSTGGGGVAGARRSGSGAGTGDGTGDVDVNGLWQRSNVIQAPPPPPLPPRVNPISMADTTASQNAEFSKAKDRVGRVGRASMNALSGEMRARGISGSGIEASEIGNRVDQASGALGDVANNQAVDALKRRYQIDDTNYQGDISQRGQDIGAGESNASRAMQALQLRANLHQSLMSLASRNGGRVY